jgi:6-phosphogluconolactonase (cycloisomerase 2 family)
LVAVVAALISILGVACTADANPHLSFVEVQRDGVAGVNGLEGAISVAISPDGRHLYAAGRADDALAVFSRDSRTGSLTFIEVQSEGTGGVEGLTDVFSVTVAPDGRHLYTAARTDDALVVFGRDSTTGSLTFVEVHKNGVGGVDGLGDAVSVAMSPDGRHLYVAGRADSAVAVFSRDSTTGALGFVEVHIDGVVGVDGLDDVVSVAMSSDGRHLYAAGQLDDAVAVFSRDSTTGALTFVDVQKYGVEGVDGLNGATSVTLSLDGRYLYATGGSDKVRSPAESQLGSASLERPDAVAVFSRDSTSGALAFVEVQKDGVGGVDGLFLVRSVTVSPDGKNLYAAGGGDDAVAVFSRDSTTGSLTFIEKRQDGVGGLDGLDGAASLTVSPDGKHVYATGVRDNAVAVFSVADPDIPAPADSK